MTDEKIDELAARFQNRGSARSFKRLADLMDGYFRNLYRERKERLLLGWHLNLYDAALALGPDGFRQECLMGLFKATQDYTPRKKPFLEFAKLCVRRHLRTIGKHGSNYTAK